MSDWKRRDIIALGAAGIAAATTRAAAAAGPSLSLLDAYLAIRGFKSNTAYWWSHGVRYALVGTRLIPFQRSAVIEAVRLDRDGATITSSALEGALSFALDGSRSSTIENPLTHAPIAVKPGSPTMVDYRYDADGQMTLAPSSQIAGTVRGRLTLERGDDAAVTEAFEGFAAAAPSGDPALSEISLFRSDGTSSSSRGFLRASKSVTVVRAWPYPVPEGVSARLLTTYEGKKFVNADAVFNDVGRATIEAAYPGLVDRLKAF